MVSRDSRPVIFATVPYYLPGFKGGGKMIALRNLIAAVGNEFRFKVLTANHDLGDTYCYRGITSNQWLARHDCEIFYLSPHRGWLRTIRQQLRQTDFDILYLNTIFSRPFGILPLILRRFGALPPRPMIIAPRGELAPGALALKSARKENFLKAAHTLGLFNSAIWQASSAREADDIQNVIGAEAQVRVAPDALGNEYRTWPMSRYYKQRGKLDVVFLSRITPMKNLHLAIEALRGIEGDVTLRIVGPIDDAQYWRRCQSLIASLGSRIRTDYLGPIATSEVGNCLGRHGLMLLPTAGESFGFAILEALLAGCPVLISDRTPWRNLKERGVGWDVPLERSDLMREALWHCLAMDAESHRAMSLRTREFALDYLARDDSAARNAAMFHSVSGKNCGVVNV